MEKPTCSIDGCLRKVRARSLCGAHYEAQRRERSRAGLGGVDTRPCEGCGKTIIRTKPRGTIRPFCSDECRPKCSIPMCFEPARARGWCGFHYSRWHETGDASTPLTVVHHNGKTCLAANCPKQQRKRFWCSSHYGQWRRTGQVGLLKYNWADVLECVVCHAPTGLKSGFRKFCSPACQQLWQRHDGAVPTTAMCVRCNQVIDLTQRGKGGYRRRVDVKLCRRCKLDLRKHGMSVHELASRDGTTCGICGLIVNMDARRPDLMCPSVDHIVPKAKGGTNDPANLQLAHYLCNAIKADRVLAPSPAGHA